jgi:O-antigen/teichoic acid export membrane protein
MKDRLGRMFDVWLSDGHLKYLARHSGILLSHNLAASALNFVSFVLAARALGPQLFGTLALVRSYVACANYLFNFQSWQVVVKYGADTIAGKEPGAFESLVKFGLIVDAAAAIGGALAAAAGTVLLGEWLGWDDSTRRLAQLYSISIAFNVRGAPTAVMWLCERSRMFGVINATTAGLVLAGVLAAATFSPNLESFLLCWLGGEILGSLLLMGGAAQALRATGRGGWVRARAFDALHRFSGIWRFLIITNVQSSVKQAVTEGDVLVVGGVLGSSAAGGFKVAKQFASVAGKLLGPMDQVMYLQLARLAAQGELGAFRRLIWRAGLIGAAIPMLLCIAFSVASPAIVVYTVGSAYRDIELVILLYLLAVVLMHAASPLQRSLLALGRPELWLTISLASGLIYLILIVPLVWRQGLTGAPLAFGIYQALYAVGLLVAVRHLLGRPDAAAP